MKPSACYAKIVEWSDEDQCYVGSCPGLFYGGYGDDEQAVFSELCLIVEETIDPKCTTVISSGLRCGTALNTRLPSKRVGRAMARRLMRGCPETPPDIIPRPPSMMASPSTWSVTVPL